jgi:hypothetical protein
VVETYRGSSSGLTDNHRRTPVKVSGRLGDRGDSGRKGLIIAVTLAGAVLFVLVVLRAGK